MLSLDLSYNNWRCWAREEVAWFCGNFGTRQLQRVETTYQRVPLGP